MREFLLRELEIARDRIVAALGSEDPEVRLKDMVMAGRALDRAFDEADLEAHVASHSPGPRS